MKLIVGLGNPEKQYETTRHNIGWRVLDELAKQRDEKSKWAIQGKFESEIYQLPTSNYLLAKPLTFMNHSGRAVSKLINFYKIDPTTDLLVIHDDKDLMFETLKIDKDRSSAGQRGVQNIIDELGTKNFARLRFGIGQPNNNLPTEAFVLQPFNQQEEQHLPMLIQQAIQLIN